MKDDKIKEKAAEIVEVVMKTTTDNRGYLFLEIADQLSKEGKGYTASLFKIIGENYNR